MFLRQKPTACLQGIARTSHKCGARRTFTRAASWIAALALLSALAPAQGEEPPAPPTPERLPANDVSQPEAIESEPLGSEAEPPIVVGSGGDASATGVPNTTPGAGVPGAGMFSLPDPFNLPRVPNVLRAPDERAPPPTSLASPALAPDAPPYLQYPYGAPTGYAGWSSVVPTERQQSSHFAPIEDRWRMGFPEWDRYGKGHPITDDYPYDPGRLLNPYKQNVLKGDYPIIGQHTFLNLTASEQFIFDYRQVPTPQNGFDAPNLPGAFETFGNPNQTSWINNVIFSVDLSHGDSSFKPADWRIRVTPVIDANFTAVRELGVVEPDIEEGRKRYQTWVALQEWFVESKICDLSADYDFMSVRGGAQAFTSDFRGFLFSDTNRAVRLFGTRKANREQFNLACFWQLEKDTNSFLNTFDERKQTVMIANWYRQDTIFPGYTAQFSFHFNTDGPSTKFDRDFVLVRPDPAGVATKHEVDAYYIGWAGDGHINRLNISHQFYQVLGFDSLNPIAGQPIQINAQFAACELSYDRDWVRFRTSGLWASGEDDPFNDTGHGFDTIFDNPNFAGGGFSYWQRQAIRLQGVNLKQRGSLIANLRSSKTQGQSNFFNPGTRLINFGMDFDVTQKLRIVQNTNFIWFDQVGVLKQFIFQQNIDRQVGTDVSLGAEYRPLLNNNIILTGGLSCLIPGQGFKDIYNNVNEEVPTLYAAFTEMIFTY